ncbi:rod shape-determining protein MreC [Adhaeribacter radiodurans]|uniref:Cell shape-determining protein MreC n=1 Tax=Adhaeribacter radiodurans TaxID=2745197 RepID=A0A7L7L3L2_9BACT|nr:rod shape-determining protein MreC [Adhaeribacter radiodurans]QMU26959.1 rod shape-determining protein MreC [Adhaeribacter radiodurans]
MRNLFAFIYRYRAFLVFILLEIGCGYLIIRNNKYQNAAFFNSANYYVGEVLAFRSQVFDYFRLVQVNQTLVQENTNLRQQLYRIQAIRAHDSLPAFSDSVFIQTDSIPTYDSLKIRLAHEYIPAKVINNSIRQLNNFLTLNVGSADGISPGMGVIAAEGLIGRVKTVSLHFATVTSLLHSKMFIAAKIKSRLPGTNNTIGTIKWDGADARMALLDYVPLDKKIVKGDTIVSSGYNAVYPDGVLIGTIVSASRESDKSFYTIKIKLAVDFSRLSFVYVVKNKFQAEQDSLEIKSGVIPSE